ncbi:MAG: transglutaminase domain-containing protein [Phycisphaerales bacterium]
MKFRKIIFMLLLISATSPAELTGQLPPRLRRNYPSRQSTSSTQNKTVEFDLSYSFFAPKETTKIKLIVVLPQTLQDKQEILSIKYSQKPSRTFRVNGNRYAEFVFLRPKKRTKLKISVKARLFRYDLLTAGKKNGREYYEQSELEEYLKREKYIEKDNPKIRQIAENIEGQTEVEIVNNIFNYVIDNLKYHSHSGKDWGALKALKKKKGDCSEYSDLFIALCRAKNIPAKFISGYIRRPDSARSKHNWAEVYLQKYGWVPFDPTTGDINNRIFRKMAFERLRPVYIYFSNIRNDEVLNNYYFAGYTYWGDKPRLKDSIKFK